MDSRLRPRTRPRTGFRTWQPLNREGGRREPTGGDDPLAERLPAGGSRAVPARPRGLVPKGPPELSSGVRAWQPSVCGSNRAAGRSRQLRGHSRQSDDGKVSPSHPAQAFVGGAWGMDGPAGSLVGVTPSPTPGAFPTHARRRRRRKAGPWAVKLGVHSKGNAGKVQDLCKFLTASPRHSRATGKWRGDGMCPEVAAAGTLPTAPAPAASAVGIGQWVFLIRDLTSEGGREGRWWRRAPGDRA